MTMNTFKSILWSNGPSLQLLCPYLRQSSSIHLSWSKTFVAKKETLWHQLRHLKFQQTLIFAKTLNHTLRKTIIVFNYLPCYQSPLLDLLCTVSLLINVFFDLAYNKLVLDGFNQQCYSAPVCNGCLFEILDFKR